MEKAGIYIHVPFCKSKCAYCDFYSLPGENIPESYADAVINSFKPYKNTPADTIYFGGGTPTLLSPVQVSRILDNAQSIFKIDTDCEITMEANPDTASAQYLKGIKEAGVNRLSFGVQSVNDRELKALGRRHSAAEAVKAINLALGAGIEDISADLMLGIPYQDEKSLENSINTVSKLPLSHISAYILKLEETVPLYNSPVMQSAFTGDEVSDLYLKAVESLEERGFLQYEISNFAKQGRESRHNLKYWNLSGYLGFGPSAHSFFGGRRFKFSASLDDFINGVPPEEDGTGGGYEEYIMLSLRLCSGIDTALCGDKYNIDTAKLIRRAKELEKRGYAKINGNNISLTKTGFLISNSIIGYLLEV